MSDHTRKVVEKFVHRMHSEANEAFRMLNPDGKITILGQTEVSGTYTGPDELFAHLTRFADRVKVWPAYKFADDIIVDGDRAFLRASGQAEFLYGRYVQPHYGYYMRVEGDGFAEIIEYMDPVQLELAMFGKKLVPA